MSTKMLCLLFYFIAMIFFLLKTRYFHASSSDDRFLERLDFTLIDAVPEDVCRLGRGEMLRVRNNDIGRERLRTHAGSAEEHTHGRHWEYIAEHNTKPTSHPYIHLNRAQNGFQVVHFW